MTMKLTRAPHPAQRILKATYLGAAACGFLLFLASGPAPAADGEAAVKSLWTKHCLKCHGPDGKGNTRMGRQSGVKDYTDEKVQAELKEEAGLKAIKEGIVIEGKKKMEPYDDKLSAEEQKALLDYMRTFGKK
jgi:mono/diheme cytochrome c family protein